MLHARFLTQICRTRNLSPLEHPAALYEVAREKEREGLILLQSIFYRHNHSGHCTLLEAAFESIGTP